MCYKNLWYKKNVPNINNTYELRTYFQFFRIDDEHCVDATFKGNVARYINHSCNPNCYTKIVMVEGHRRIGNNTLIKQLMYNILLMY